MQRGKGEKEIESMLKTLCHQKNIHSHNVHLETHTIRDGRDTDNILNTYPAIPPMQIK